MKMRAGSKINVIPQHERLLSKLFEAANSAQFLEIEALMIGGSVGRGDTDRYSDIDLFLLVDNDALQRFLATRLKEFAGQLGEIVLFRGPIFVEGFGHSFTILFRSQLLCQFNVNSHNTLIPNPMNNQEFLMIYDRTGYYTDFLQSEEPVEVDEREIFDRSFSFFWLRALSTRKEIERNNLWLAIRHLADLRNQMFVLERLNSKNPPPGLNFGIPSKAAEKELSRKFNTYMEGTLCDYSNTSVARALIKCVKWYYCETARFLSTANNKEDARYLQTASELADTIARDLPAEYRMLD